MSNFSSFETIQSELHRQGLPKIYIRKKQGHETAGVLDIFDQLPVGIGDNFRHAARPLIQVFRWPLILTN